MKRYLFLIIFSLITVLCFVAGVFAENQIKTTETHITQSEDFLSSATSSDFSLYIGDNISDVKSVHIAISGVYTGNGTLEAQINSNAATSQTFTFPNVGSTPTPFEVLYKDPSSLINPSSAGTYTYTLNLIPTDITIYGLGVKAVESHEYNPPACGGYAATGELVSSTFDTTIVGGASYNSLFWQGTLPVNTKVGIQLATSNCTNGDTNYPNCNDGIGWQYYGDTDSDGVCQTTEYYEVDPATPAEILCLSTHSNTRYFRYKVRLCSASNCSTAGTTTPQVDDVVVNWAP